MSTATSDIKQDIENLKARIQTLSGLFAQEVDIHTHTRQIGPHYQYFNVIDQRYNLSSSTQPLEDVIKEILERCPEAHKKNITTVLNTIRATTRADNETHANLQELLIRTWSLVNMPNNHSNAFNILIQNLDHNIATGGGCVPGIAARLIQPYTHFVLRMLQQIPANKKAPEKIAPIATRQVTEKELIQQAIAESLKTLQTHTRPVAISPAVPTNTKQTKPVVHVLETKVHQEIDPLSGEPFSQEQILAQARILAQFEQRAASQKEREQAARAATRQAKEDELVKQAIEESLKLAQAQARLGKK